MSTPKSYLDVKTENYIELTNGMKVNSISYHFVDRIIGNVSEKRSGVDIKDIFTDLQTSTNIKMSKRGNNTYKVFGKYSIITINTDGNLVQVNPQ